MQWCTRFKCPCEGIGWYVDVAAIDCDEECDECEWMVEE